MAAVNFLKRASAPAGTVTINVNGHSYTWTDTVTPVAVSDAHDTSVLMVHPYIVQSGTVAAPSAYGALLDQGNVISVNAAYTASVNDALIFADPTGAAFTVTLPSAAGRAGKELTIVNTTAGANLVTIGGTVSGVANPTIANLHAMKVASDGTNWYKVEVV